MLADLHAGEGALRGMEKQTFNRPVPVLGDKRSRSVYQQRISERSRKHQGYGCDWYYHIGFALPEALQGYPSAQRHSHRACVVVVRLST